MVHDAGIPAALQHEEQWIAWRSEPRDGKETKVPIDPATGAYARVNDAATWHGFADALQYYRAAEEVDGLGFVFADGPYAGIDLDDCRNPDTGEVTDLAEEIITRLDSYTEISPSGTGLHVLLQGAVPDGGNRRGDLEMYDQDRYFTVSGDHVTGTPPTVEDRADELRAVHDEYIAIGPGIWTEQGDARTHVPLTDEELITKAKQAANGDKFRRLWEGDTSRYPSHSEADLALAAMLAFWTQGDPQRIEELFSQSGLTRDKWKNREDYRKRTIRKAIQTCTEFYDPRADA